MIQLIQKIKKIIIRVLTLGQVHYINGSETMPPPLEREEEAKVIDDYFNGSNEARNILIVHNLRLVVYVAKRYEMNITNLEDLISIGTIGLIKAIQTFKVDKNIKLATYASRCIENEILMFLRKKNRRKIEVSLDEPLNVDYDGNELLLSDILSNDGDYIVEEIESNESKEMVLEAIKDLKEREIEILSMRYGLNGDDEMTQKDVADALGISQSYISRLEKKIIKKLKNKMYR